MLANKICKRRKWRPVAKMFISSKLGKPLLEMELIRTFSKIKKVIWDHLLATKAEIMQSSSKLYFRFACALPDVAIISRLDIFCFAVFLFLSFVARQGHFVAKSLKKSSKQMFPFNFQLSGNNSGFF